MSMDGSSPASRCCRCRDRGLPLRVWARCGPRSRMTMSLHSRAITRSCSIEGARRNLESELPHWDFDKVREDAGAEWNCMLSRIDITGRTEPQRVKFYTDLFHSIKGRRCISDADGRLYPTDLYKPLRETLIAHPLAPTAERPVV